jgi:uncharacterized protein YdaU (DUF1376 family)
MFAGGGSLTACPSPSVMLPVAKGLGARMSRHHPWSAFYWDDWATDTAHLSDSEYAIYHRLLTHYYKTQKPLLANATSLLRVCLAFTSDQQAAMSSVLSQFFVLKGENYHNKRADSELEKMISISKERRLVGRKGGLAKARNLLEQKAYQNPTHPQPHIQPQSQEEKSKSKATPSELFILPEWIPTESWDGYVEMRKKIRAPLTDRAARLALAELEKLKNQGYSPRGVLDQSVLNDWRGLFPIKANGNGAGHTKLPADYVPESVKRTRELAERKAQGL